MMGLLDLPNELLFGIADCLPRQRDLAYFLRISKRFHVLFKDLILMSDIKYHGCRALIWAVRWCVIGCRHPEIGCRRKRHVDMIWRSVEMQANALALYDFYEGTRARVLSWVHEDLVARGESEVIKILYGKKAQMAAHALEGEEWADYLLDTLELINGYHKRIASPPYYDCDERACFFIDQLANCPESPIRNGELSHALQHTFCGVQLGCIRGLLVIGADINGTDSNGRVWNLFQVTLENYKEEDVARIESSPELAFDFFVMLYSHGFDPTHQVLSPGLKHVNRRMRRLFLQHVSEAILPSNELDTTRVSAPDHQ